MLSLLLLSLVCDMEVYSHMGQLVYIHRQKKTVHVNYVAKASWKCEEHP